jgi:tRNA pseudouridine38-40 synthase
MPCYFVEVAYKGTHYSGFQTQENANTIQAEVEKAFSLLHRKQVAFTGSSRTDAGVHALQNFFHFDFEGEVHARSVYKMNAILPGDIVVKNIVQMPAGAHSRFDAISRRYEYRIHRSKNPFLQETSFFYPYRMDMELLHEAARVIKEQTHFYAFAKTNTQVKSFACRIQESTWRAEGDTLYYAIEGNRFLRGMVRLLVGSLLKVGRGQLSMESFQNLFHGEVKSGYSVPAVGLYLKEVCFPENYFPALGVPFTSI